MSTRLRRFITDFHACDKSVTVARADDCCCNLSGRAPSETSQARISSQWHSSVRSGRFRSTAENKETCCRPWRADVVQGARFAGFVAAVSSSHAVLDSIPIPAHVSVGSGGRGYQPAGAALQPTRAPGRRAPAARCPGR